MMTEDEQARLERLQRGVAEALRRYDVDDALRHGFGFPRGQVAWAMADDLRGHLEPGDLGEFWPPEHTPRRSYFAVLSGGEHGR